MSTLVDYAGRPPGAAAIKAAGHVGAVRYVSGDRTRGSLPGKPVSRAEVDDFRAQGLAMAFVHQWGKDSATAPPDVLRGREGGINDAKVAQAKLNEIGCPNHPVFFAVDFDITLKQWNDIAVHYFRGAAEVLGLARVGIYGHSRVCAWAAEDNVVGPTTDGKRLAWQTRSWSAGVVAAEACLYQRIVDTAATPGPRINGTVVDVNDILTSDWGQHPRTTQIPAPAPAPRKIMHFDEYLSLRQDRWTRGRGGHRIEYVTRHHMGGIGDGAKCVEWWQNRQASAHAAIDRNGKRSQIIAPEDTAWSNANSDSNYRSYSIEHSNSAGPDQDWPISDATLREGARLAAEVCLEHKLGRPHFGTNIRDHNQFTSTECPYHLRAGRKYHDTWMRYAQEHYDNLLSREEDDMFTDEDRKKIDRIYHELTYGFQSRYVDPETGKQSTFKDTMVGYILELDRKVETITAVRLPLIEKAINAVAGLFKKEK